MVIAADGAGGTEKRRGGKSAGVQDHEISTQETQRKRNLTFYIINAIPYLSTVNQGDLVHGNFPHGENDHARSAPRGLEGLENAGNSRRLFRVVIIEMLVLSHAGVVTVAHLRRNVVVHAGVEGCVGQHLVVNRKHSRDGLPHVCIYFGPPGDKSAPTLNAPDQRSPLVNTGRVTGTLPRF